MEKREATGRFQRRRRLRLTAEEDERLNRQAATAGISVSEYMRRLFFGGRPLIAKMVKKRFPETMDASRLDAAIALHMRCAGYIVQAVAEELYRHTPARPTARTVRKDRLWP